MRTDRLTAEQRKKNMQAIKSTGSKIEVALAKALHSRGHRYRKNDKSVFGRPDLTFKKLMIAIFVDSEFWHGKNWETKKNEHKSNADFWHKKIENNIARDRLVNKTLLDQGWTVLRYWGKEILKNRDSIIMEIEQKIKEKKNNENVSIDIDKIGSKQFKIDLTDSSNNKKAILSHYIHNKNLGPLNPYKDPAIAFAKEILGIVNPGRQMSDTKVEKAIDSGLFGFNEFPFPPIRNHRFTFIDLFAGIGGFRIALQNLGGKCIYTSEWDKQAKITYASNFGDVPFGDITSEESKSFIPDNFDVLCAGFPCQAFSIAGKRGGFEDTRGTLFFDVAEIIRRKQPSAIFLENVKGLRNHDKGKTLSTILNVLREDLGYYVPDPQILNAKDFGVPQNRERIFIVGFHPRTAVTDFTYPSPTDQTATFADIKEEQVVPTKFYLSTQYLQTLKNHKSRHESKGNGFGYQIIPDDGTANAVVCGGMGRERNLVYDDRITDFVPTTKITGEVNREGIRKMTPREWARLQGFPADFKIVVADASAYKQFGNSVAVPAIQATANEIIKKLF